MVRRELNDLRHEELNKAAVREGLLMRSPAEALDTLPEDASVQREPFSMPEISRGGQPAGSSEEDDLYRAERIVMTSASAR